MESSQLKVDNRPILYWNKFQYRARLRIDGLRMTYGATSLDDVENNVYRAKSYGGRVRTVDYPNIEKWLSYRVANKDNILVRIEGDCAGIFSNDLEVLKKMESIGLFPIDYSQACASDQQGLMYFTNEPKYKHRSYLKAKKIEKNAKDDLREFIHRYQLTPCGALQQWLDGNKYRFVSSYIPNTYFISYDDEKMPMLMSMMFPGLFSKHYKLEKRPTE